MTMTTRMRPLRGQVTVPGDKSIGHRACMLAAIGTGASEIVGLSGGGDNQSTRHCLSAAGATFESGGANVVRVEGRGLRGLRGPGDPLDCGNSGTTLRLLMGLLAGIPGESFTLTGDASLVRRPMERVAAPLRRLGADVVTAPGGRPPVGLRGVTLTGGRVVGAVASAQVKSAVLLAGLGARSETTYVEPIATRDHTERMFVALGLPLVRVGDAWTLTPVDRVPPHRWSIPGDPSSAAFWCAAALLTPGSELTLPGVCLNPGRTGFLRVLERMGAEIGVEDAQMIDGEPTGTLTVRYGPLRGTTVTPDEVPDCIDELPLLALLATTADGSSEIRGAGELAVKESDRIAAMAALLRADGAHVEVHADGWTLAGGHRPMGGFIARTHGDHRVALCAALLDAAAPAPVVLDAPEAIDVSYPGFVRALADLRTPSARLRDP